jgi:hypothetical protein
MYIIVFILLVLIITYYLLFNINNKEHFTLNQNIPKVIYLTYKTKDIPESVINKFKKVYPDYEIKIYDNNDCIEFLNKEFGQEYVDIFNFIKDGPIKADFWRVCILYKYGGIYSDVDVVPNINIEEILEPDTTFVTCLSAFRQLVNPHFIVSVPNHIVLKLCIDKYLEFYRTKKTYSYWGWSIVYIMKDVLYKILNKSVNKDGIYKDDNKNQYQFLQEVSNFKFTDIFHLLKLFDRLYNYGKGMHCEYDNKIILFDKNENYSNHGF